MTNFHGIENVIIRPLFSLFWSSAKIFNRFLLIHVLSAIVFISSDFLNMNLVRLKSGIFYLAISCFLKSSFAFQIFQNHATDIGVILFATSQSVSDLYVYCYFGDYTTNSFEKYTQYLCEMRWYRLPIEYQKYLILLIGNGQQPLQYDGYRLVIINRGTFLKVTTSIISL